MPADNIQDQLIKYLADAHSIEEQALQQVKKAPKIANAPGLATAFEEHLAETEKHEKLTRERLEELGASPSKFKDLVMRAGGEGFVWFARSQPDTTGKLAAHAYSYEALELGSYEMLLRVALRAGDHETARIAREIRADEQRMLERIGSLFDETVETSLAELSDADIEEHLVDYLTDAHAIENQAKGLLTNGPKLAGDEQLATLFEEHLRETEEHLRLVEARLEAHDESPSKLKDIAMKMGALNWGGFFAAHPDTVGKLNVFAFAFEHLEIGGYEQLLRVARRAGDTETVAAADRILTEERAAARKLSEQFDHTAERSLEVQGVSA
jgi:ferritin-like metal-binding protein YciE